MLDILEGLCDSLNYYIQYERIDGSITGQLHHAIDRSVVGQQSSFHMYIGTQCVFAHALPPSHARVVFYIHAVTQGTHEAHADIYCEVISLLLLYNF